MNFIKKINIVGVLFLLFWSSQLMGQGGANPFELQHRADKKTKIVDPSGDIIEEVTESDVASQNPFDVVRIPVKVKSPIVTPQLEKKAKSKSTEITVADDKNFRFSLTLAMLIFLALSLSVYRTHITKAYHAFTNENVLRMLHREKGTVAYIPYYILYMIFLFNLGVYIYLLLRYYNLTPEISNLSLLMMTGGIATGLVLLKHLVINILGWVFPIEKETSIYSMTMTIFGIILSIVLFVANVIIAYAPPQIIPIVIYFSFIIIGIVYFFRSIRGLSIASKFLNRNKFHFFIYLCAVEIAPVLILWKMAMSGTGIQ
ncbi:MAG: DUF4271 domain-containing protein [Saprospiraceae bacterium]